VSPEKGGDLRTTQRRAYRYAITGLGAFAFLVAPLVAFGATGPAPRAFATAPDQQLLSDAVTATTTSPTHVASIHHTRTHPIHNSRPRSSTPRGTTRRVTRPRVLAVTTTTRPIVRHVTTTRPPTHKVTRPTPPASHERVGDATWYSWYPGQCAVHYLPKGTRITVEDLATGKSISCLVTDYEVDASRAVDLNETQFAELAPLAQGVIRVKVTW
jgi:hypothetical protein